MRPEVLFKKKPKKKTKRQSRFFTIKKILSALVAIAMVTSIYGANKPLPEGISYQSQSYSASDIEFLYDLTYENTNGKTVHDQEIFDTVFQLIDDAESFIVMDMFLLNNEYDRSKTYPPISTELVEALINKKHESPKLPITVITDEINTFYGSYPSKLHERLEKEGIQVVYTDLTKLRDSNPVYSGVWRAYFQWFGTKGNGWLPNPFSPDSPEVTARSYLELLNFKANHRKVLITDKQGLVTSANPHDASGYHSNIAFVVKGPILQELLKSEAAVAELSGSQLNVSAAAFQPEKSKSSTTVQLVTEGEIRQQIIAELNQVNQNDQVYLGMFYLSERKIIEELIAAANRGAELHIILDPNKDAFGREKNGIPNRPVAQELIDKSNGKIKVRWYDTDGEQYHTKLLFIKRGKESVAIGGSANYTKRNISDLNLETDLVIKMPAASNISKEMEAYFKTIWSNETGTFTTDYAEYKPSGLDWYIYRFQEWSGLSTF